ncbi:MAG: hypothetical protein M0Q15_17825 [Nevskia sp.]|jgi:hypothetical protein|nr:hypothetical protein [Nevskia sp.]
MINRNVFKPVFAAVLAMSATVPAFAQAGIPTIDSATAGTYLLAAGGAAIAAAGLSQWALGAISAVVSWAKRTFMKG